MNSGVDKTISVTDAALQHIKKYIAKRGSGIGLRLHIAEAGCSGYRYVVDYVDVALPEDKVFAIDDDAHLGLAVYVNSAIYPQVQGTIIDYRKEGLTSRFVFENPNQTGGCGCGESFTVD